MKRYLLALTAVVVLLIGAGCGNQAESTVKTEPTPKPKTEQVVQKTKKTVKQSKAKNEYCEMKGGEFIQKDRKGREEVLLLCLTDYPQRAKIYAEMQTVLDKANGYFTTSEAWEAPVTKFLDDYVAGKVE